MSTILDKSPKPTAGHSIVTARAEDHSDLVNLLALLRGMESTDCPAVRTQGSEGDAATIPESIIPVLVQATEILARGDSLALVPIGRELTTQQAADLLNVSRQYLVRLIEEGEIPHRKTGTHRRLRVEDVLAYKEARDAKRRSALDELTRLSQEYGGYSELE